MNFKSLFVSPRFPENLQHLYDLSYNLWTTWNIDALNLFYRIDGTLFTKVQRNPLKFLHSLSKDRLEELSNNNGFLFELEKVWNKFQHYLKYSRSFRQDCINSCHFEEGVVAYFSMEFGLHESIHIYAGGLGILAGDFLKGASDLDLPVIGIGLMYKYGYFTQYIDVHGYQQEVFTKFENRLIPMREIRDSQGNWAHVTLKMQNEQVKIKLWQIDIGKSKLILLDTDIEENPPMFRDITHELYASNREKRLQQELVLGIGGVRALELLGINVKVYHFNEGHSAFAIIGRLQNLMQNRKFSLPEAKAIIRSSTVFTTHTPVKAGNEIFNTEMVRKYLQHELSGIDLSFNQIASAGFVDGNENFWLPAFAMRYAKYINAVALQHRGISQKMWAMIYPQMPVVEIPVTHITNGVHTSWISPPFTDLFNRYLGPDYIHSHCRKGEKIWDNIYSIPDVELWEEHRRNKKDLFNYIRRQLTERTSSGGFWPTKISSSHRSLNIDHLTIAFAKRFAAYKRPTLILKDKDRLRRILTNSAKPVQIIFAGKAHPADEQCKSMIKDIFDFAKEYQVEDKIIFLENYDINIARYLTWGADIWLNYPAPDMEASGTSGMKAAMNGVLHLSTLEGWWVEGYDGKNGWSITAGRNYDRTDLQETADANQLYDMLEYKITDLYYKRNEMDVPENWLSMMKNSIFSTCQNFNMNRVLCQYFRHLYIPAKDSYERIVANDAAILKKTMEEEQLVLKHWDNIEITSLMIGQKNKDEFIEGQPVEITCGVRFGQALPKLFTVELFYIHDSDANFQVLPMELSHTDNNIAYYKHSLDTQGYGSQTLNVRVRPSNEIIRDSHPELIKWKD